MARNSEVLGYNHGRFDVCHQGCAYAGLQTVQKPVVCSVVYGTVHYI